MFRKNKLLLKVLILGILITISPFIFGQSYGLEFKGMDVTQDNRTELNLTPNDYLTFQGDFDISFDYKATRLRPNRNVGLFGYIVRVINKEDNNVDILSSIIPGRMDLNLNVVVGKKDDIIDARYSEENLDNWIRLRIKFDLAADKMIFYTPDSFHVQERIGFKKKDDFKIIFGTNDYKQFKTSDVPTMSIRDVKITEQGKLKYHWLLDELENNSTRDKIVSKEAIVKNPSWLKLNHVIWKSSFQRSLDGQTMMASDEANGRIFMVGEKELIIYSLRNKSSRNIAYQNKPDFQNLEFKTIYNSTDEKIYCYLFDAGISYALDVNSGKWTEILGGSNVESANRHHNRFYNPDDNSIYTFGGYGLHKYNNRIRKIDISKKVFSDLPTNDSIYHPKYLAGLGSLNDTLYILGGYGSKSGNQLINPQSYYDLIGYSIKDSTLFKKFEIPHIIDDMCVANSMWIDESTREYYALIFEKSKFNGYLQLVKGSLDSPDIELLGNEIPFRFLDIRSTASLLYAPEKNKLYAYTNYVNDSTKTQTNIYSINYPPNNYEKEVEIIEKESYFSTVFFAISGVIVLFVLVYLLYKKSKKVESSNVVNIEKTNESIEKSAVEQVEVNLNKTEDYNLIFFGGFQVVNKTREDITSHFTPLLKELFLLIWLHTFKNNKGISTEKITEVLWYDKTEKSAQNNRAVNLAKLRSLLSELGSFKLSKKTGYWKAMFNEAEIKSDYVDFLNLTSSKTNLTKQKIYQLIEITKKGPFLRNVQYPWLDEYKARVSDITIDTLVYFANLSDVNMEADFIIHMADSIFIFDVTNEEAMVLKCKAQYVLGKHSHAKATYKKFSKEYVEMYGQEYDQSFVDILNIDE